jgi:hypothetical protein
LKTPVAVLALAAAIALLPASFGLSDARASSEVISTMEFVAWSSTEEVFCVRVTDNNRGMYFSVLSLEDASTVRDYPFMAEDEKKVWRKVARTHKCEDELVTGQASPKGDLTVMGVERGAHYEIVVNDGKRMGQLLSIELAKDDRGKRTARGRLKEVAWTPDGKHVLVIVHQLLEGSTGFDRDFVHVKKYRRWKVKWK